MSLPKSISAEDRLPEFVNIQRGTGIKTVDAVWSLPMIREIADAILKAHKSTADGKGWIPPTLYNVGLGAVVRTAMTTRSIAESTVNTSKAVRKRAPAVVERALDTVIEKAKFGVDFVDDIGANGLENLKTKVPIVGDNSQVAKEKVVNLGKEKIGNLQDFVSSTWIGQTTLNILDTTLTITEKPLAFIGNVEVVDSVKETESGSGKKVVHFKVKEKSKHFKLDVYTYGLHGKLVNSARYFLKKVRHTRKNVRNSRNVGQRIRARKEKEKRKRLVFKSSSSTNSEKIKRFIASLWGVGTVMANLGLLNNQVCDKEETSPGCWIKAIDEDNDSDLPSISSLGSFDYESDLTISSKSSSPTLSSSPTSTIGSSDHHEETKINGERGLM